MLNVNKWVYNFNSLDPDNQLKVADAIIEELKDNERYLDAEDEYNNEMSQAVRLFFNKMVKNVNTKQELKSNIELFKEFDSLSEDNKNKVINEIFKIIKKYLEIQEQENKKMMCKKEGHIFSEWKKATWFTEEPVWDAGLRGYVKVEHENWKRTCSRCGFVETVKEEPTELIAARKEKNRKKRIRKLEAEL